MKMRNAAYGILLFFSANAHAQIDAISGNLNNGPILSVHGKLSNGFLESFKTGTPLYSNDWQSATLLLNDGTVIPEVPVRINLVNHEVYYRAGDKQYVATSPINEIRLKAAEESKPVVFVAGSRLKQQPNALYIEVLKGTASLYKFIEKVVEESRPYSSATMERNITSKEHFYVFHRHTLQEVKKLRELPELFFDKKAAVKAYIESKKLAKLNEATLVDVLTYYNTLQQ